MRRHLTITLAVLIALAALWLIVTLRFIPVQKGGIGGKKAIYDLIPVKLFSFSSDNALKEWEDKIFKGKVIYKIEKDEDLSYVQAHSAGNASALYYKIKMDVKNRRPVLRWKWRVEKFPVKSAPESLEIAGEDDFAGRVYVIFPAMFILNSQVVEYIWAEKLPAGSTGTSPYSKNIKLMVLESGPAKDGKFISEERDVLTDYITMFGKPPERDIGAVAFMTNTEHTNTSADAMYDEIELGYKEK